MTTDSWLDPTEATMKLWAYVTSAFSGQVERGHGPQHRFLVAP